MSRRAVARLRTRMTTASDSTITAIMGAGATTPTKPTTPQRAPLAPGSGAPEFALFAMMPFGRAPAHDQAAQKEAKSKFIYPNDILTPHFGRRQASMIAISGAIGTGLFLGSGSALYAAGSLGVVLGYAAWAIVVYGFIVSTTEMVTVYPYCHGTVGLANVFVDPALGFAMGWNAWYHWGITIPSQIAYATSLLKYWNPAGRLAALWPFIFIAFSLGSVIGARRYGELQSWFAYIKMAAILLLVIIGLLLDLDEGAQPRTLPVGKPKVSRDLFKYYDHPFQQYLGIKGGFGRFLGWWATFMQACVSYFGTEIPTLIAGEIKDAPRVLPRIARRIWLRIVIFYLAGVFIASTLVPASSMGTHNIVPSDPNSPEDDAPWDGSAFLLALNNAAAKNYRLLTNLFIAAIITSAASAASTEVFLASRYLFFLSEAGHAPKIFGYVWPRDKEGREEGRSVPIVGLLTTAGFSTWSFMAMRPGANTMSNAEKVFHWITSMVAAASLQAWIGALFTYLRFYMGTNDPGNMRKYSKEIARIKQNRAWGQPYWAVFSISMCILVLIVNGWSSFKEGVWIIYRSPATGTFTKDQVVKFVTTYLPIPVLLLLVFGYKLINQTTMTGIEDMDFSGVSYEGDGDHKEELRPTSFWGRVWWLLVY